MSISRRDVLKYAAAAPVVLGLGAGLQAVSSALAPPRAAAAPLGILLDYAAGVIRATRSAGRGRARRHPVRLGPAARGAWMLGKPIQLPEARDLYQNGLKIVSCYQYGKQDTADWLGGQNAGVAHAKRGWQLHVAAGGSYGAPIYASIDDDPSYDQYKQQVAPYLRGWESVLGHQRVGRVRQLQDHRLGAAGRAGLLLLAAQLGLAEGFTHPGRAPASGRDRQAQRRRASASTSTTILKPPVRAVGLKRYRSVSRASKLFC